MTERLRAERAADQVAEPMGHRPRSELHSQREVRPTYDGPDLGPGRPLHPQERVRLEPALGVRLDSVRVHTDDRAAELTDAYGAAAFSTGQHVVLGRGRDPQEAAPGSDAGQRTFGLLAHEVAHTVQHRGVPGTAVHRQVAKRPDGIGRTPPPELFDRAEGVAAADIHLLFEQDDIKLSSAGVQRLAALLRDKTTAVQVDIDGYASTEGDDEYNVNLSAWRAAAVSHVLTGRGEAAITLPVGSQVRLIAHGETAAFGAREQNRRVGIRVTALPTEPLGGRLHPEPRPRTGSRFGLEPLQLDPSLLVPPSGELPPLDRPRLLDPKDTGSLRPGISAGSGGPPSLTPVPSPRLTPSPSILDPYGLPGQPLPPVPRSRGLDWSGINRAYSDRGVRLTDRDQAAIERHFTTYYELFVRAGLPPDKAESLTNTVTRVAIDREMARENPNVIDRFNADYKAAHPNDKGIPPLSIDVLEVVRWLQR
jgi:outer membrane protein OmpA-like peptidoglycan-associated protein